MDKFEVKRIKLRILELKQEMIDLQRKLLMNEGEKK